MNVSNISRARRLLDGWSANLFQMLLGITQQIALVPIFLHFWTSDVLAAWLAIYAAGNLVLIADAGLQFRCINRFLAFKSSVDGDGRTARFYALMLRVYFGLAGTLAIAVLVGTQVLYPSAVLRFQATSNFDAAFIVVTVGMLLTLPANLVTGLYRTYGRYGRAVWLQSAGMLMAQLGQLLAIVVTNSLLAVALAYVVMQVATAVYLLTIDAPRQLPFLRSIRGRPSWAWISGQFRAAFPFGVAGASEIAIQFVPVLLVSALVSDRVAVAQWGLTRVIAGLLRTVCYQTTLPLAAELGHDYALGLKEQLRSLYARGSVFATLLTSVVAGGLLAFWPEFFALWTHRAIPYDPVLTVTLLIGTAVSAPSMLAFAYANYTNSGALLVRTKGLQLAVFLILSVVLIPLMGPTGAAVAIVAGDLLIQFGLLGIIVIRQILQHPFRHIAFLTGVMVVASSCGWGLGVVIRSLAPGSGLTRFACECILWLVVVVLVAIPMTNRGFRSVLTTMIPR
jgi:O-antigen/teichoic acid export membrane protein